MALFNGNKETKEEKQARKTQELLDQYGLTDLSDPADLKNVRQIASELTGNTLIVLGAALQGKAEETAKITCLRAIIEQNWIIIRQLDRLNKNLEK